MKKVLICSIMILLALVNIDIQDINAISDVQEYTGITIDETEYTDYLVYDEAESTGVNAVGTVISYVKFVSATAKHLTSDTYVVIMYAEVEPIDSWYLNMHSTQVGFLSHVDDEYYLVPNGYGAFYSSAGYEMTQPIPSSDPTMSSYDVGVELGTASPPVFGVSETIIANSLKIDNDSSYSDDDFDVKYNYSCTGFLNKNCDYQNDPTTQKGTFKVDTSGGLGNRYRADFYSVSKFTYVFQNSSGLTFEAGYLEVNLKIF